MSTNETPLTMTGWSEVIHFHQKTLRKKVDTHLRKDQPSSIIRKQFSETDEKVLILAAKQGNVEAFNQLVSAYQDRLFTQAYYILGDRMAAEDAVQEAFLSAYRSFKTYRGGSLRGWFFRIVTNKCLDELRNGKHTLETDFTEDDEWLRGIDSLSWPDNSGETPEDCIIRNETERYMLRCLNHLPTQYRIAIVLVDIFEMHYREAGKIMGCPVGTVKSRLARARLQMRCFLRNHGGIASQLFNKEEIDK